MENKVENKKEKKIQVSFPKGKVKGYLYLLLTAVIIELTWKGYEMIRFGETTTDPFHTVVAIVLAFSIVELIKTKEENAKQKVLIQRQNKQIKKQSEAIKEATEIIQRVAEREEKKRNEERTK